MASQLHPDKESYIYAEWKVVKHTLQRVADAETAQKQKEAPPGETVRPVRVPEIIRRLTLQKANDFLAQHGERLLDLDPSSSPSLHRGERFSKESGKLVATPLKLKTVELPPNVTPEMFKLWAEMTQEMIQKQEGEAA